MEKEKSQETVSNWISNIFSLCFPWGRPVNQSGKEEYTRCSGAIPTGKTKKSM